LIENTLRVLLPEFVENIGGIESSVIAQLPGDDFQRTSEGTDQELLLASNAAGYITQVFGQLHFNSTSTCL
jgi:hypothetical protein